MPPSRVMGWLCLTEKGVEYLWDNATIILQMNTSPKGIFGQHELAGGLTAQ
jgi:hypothetical protein